MPSSLNTAVIGTGMSATVFHIPFIRALSEYFTLHTIMERSATDLPSREKYWSERYQTNVKVAKTLDEVLANGQIQVVVLSTPNRTHYEYAKAALEAGKHVIIEKPLVPSVTEADELIKLASSKNQVLATYQNRRWDSDFLTLRRLLEVENVFGELSEFESRFDRYKPGLKGNTWKETDEPGHGVVFDLGSHLIDQVLTLFGTPHSVSAQVLNSRSIGPSNFADSFVATFSYPPHSSLRPESSIPLTATVRSSSLSILDPQLRFTLKGTKASWVKYGVDPQEDQRKEEPPVDLDHETFGVESEDLQGILTTIENDGKTLNKVKVESEKGEYISWYRNVGEAISAQDPTKLLVQPFHAREVIRMVELIYKSSTEGRVVLAKEGAEA